MLRWRAKGKADEQGVQLQFEVLSIRLVGGTGDATAPADVVLMPFGEPTEFGWMVLPDQPELQPAGSDSSVGGNAETMAAAAHGFGPLYISKLRRVA